MGCDRETRSEPLDAIGGRLWSTAEDDSDADEIATKSGCSPPALSYLCRAPSPSPSQSLTSPSSSSAETSSSSLRGDRVAKRIQKRTDQRRAMMELMAMPSPSVSPNRVFNGLRMQVSPARKELPKAVLEPSVFVLEEFKADEWIKFERGGGSGYGNGRGNGGNGYSNFNQQNFSNANYARGSQGFPPPDHNARSGFNNGQYGGGDRWFQNDGWQGDQGGFDSAGFGGDFGNFSEGYFDRGQGFGHNYNGNGFGGVQNRTQRQYRNPSQAGRGRGGRGGRGRLNGHGSGGRIPPAAAVQEVRGSGTEQHSLAASSQSQQVVQSVATLQPLLNAQTLQQVLHGIQQQNTTQGGTMANEVSVVASETGKGPKKKDKIVDIVCFKCDDSGHFAADCQAVLCLLCDSAKHATVDCHYDNMPKPTAVMYGLCRDDLLFFDIPKTDGVKSKRDSGKNGIIRVKGGSMSVHQIIKELSFVVPGNHHWDISQTGENVFSVVYPSKADKARLRKINDIKVDDSGCTMFFEEGTNQNLDSWKTREAWVRFSGCPKELRDDYLALFAIGSLIGKTKQVDMEFTRAGEVVRLLAQVLNPDLIPDEVEHYFDGEGFRLSIEVEGRVPQQHHDQEMEDAAHDPDDHSNPGKDSETDLDRQGKKPKRNDYVASPAISSETPHIVKENSCSQLNEISFGSISREQSIADRKVVNVVGCHSAPLPYGRTVTHLTPVKPLTATRTGDMVPKKLWADYSKSEADGLSSPPVWSSSGNFQGNVVLDSQANMQFSKSKHHVGSVNEVQTYVLCSDTADVTPSFTGATQIIPSSDTVDHLPGVMASSVTCAPDGSPSISLDAVESEVSLLVSEEKKDVFLTPVARSHEPRHEDIEHPAAGLCSASREEIPVVSTITPGGGGVSRPSLHSPKTAMSGGHGGVQGTGVYLGGRYSKKEIIAYGGIPEPLAAGVRSSERIRAQPNADATQLERAQHVLSSKAPGTSSHSKFVVASLSNDVVLETAKSLGVSLGVSSNEESSSIDLIKNHDLQRTLHRLKKREEETTQKEEGLHSLALDDAILLSQDLSVEEQKGSADHKDSTTFIVKKPCVIKGGWGDWFLTKGGEGMSSRRPDLPLHQGRVSVGGEGMRIWGDEALEEVGNDVAQRAPGGCEQRQEPCPLLPMALLCRNLSASGIDLLVNGGELGDRAAPGHGLLPERAKGGGRASGCR
ncbi:hypothetical protein ACQ4PT_008746 [Festuca glaucescens]